MSKRSPRSATKIAVWRNARRLSQAELGQRMIPKQSRDQVNRMEIDDGRRITLPWLRSCADALGVSVVVLFNDEDVNPSDRRLCGPMG